MNNAVNYAQDPSTANLIDVIVSGASLSNPYSAIGVGILDITGVTSPIYNNLGNAIDNHLGYSWDNHIYKKFEQPIIP